MTRSYSTDLRVRVIEAISGGLSTPRAAARFGVGVSTLKGKRLEGAVHSRGTFHSPVSRYWRSTTWKPEFFVHNSMNE
jgi:transposase